jgi:DNA-binding GntR family transcriptional regulator
MTRIPGTASHSVLRDAILLTSLREEIIDGSLAPGARVIESVVSQRFDVSRAAARAALACLEQEGLLVARPFQSMRVRSLTVQAAGELVDVLSVLQPVLALRAAEAAESLNRPGFRELEGALLRAASERNLSELASHGWRLHALIARGSGHSVGTQLVERITAQLGNQTLGQTSADLAQTINRQQSLIRAVSSGQSTHVENLARGAVIALYRAVWRP